ncbi:sin3 histone deacetylase corepressor complex component SDS3 [Bacillus rossius redtenbacheri]|uniref:sin3 histone deacetylase corepressor complex component SDS3 n=1 Tax=Bacillus rossius redtenbacheri TaxID=93214 RepID=UPI002FDE9A4F
MSSHRWMSSKSAGYYSSKSAHLDKNPGTSSSAIKSNNTPLPGESSFSSSFMCDEYDFEDDHDDEIDDGENEEREESDEDTEEASETDMGKNEEFTEIKEQMYKNKLSSLKKQLQQLKDGTHPEYNRKLKRLDMALKERLRLNTISRDYMVECVEREYVIEQKAIAKKFEEDKVELRETLIADLEEKRKIIEADRHTMELTGDSMEVKPAMTRKLRRRPNDPVPIPEKRRKLPPAQLNYLLDEKEIENDLKIISRGKTVGPVRKPALIPAAGVSTTSSQAENPLPDIRVEDGKLLFEKRWFHRGQPVYVEGKDYPRFPGIISAIGMEVIWVKKIVDGSKVRIYMSQLMRGKMSIKRRAS